MFMPSSARRVIGLFVASTLLVTAGCKPSGVPGTGHSSASEDAVPRSDNNASRQPTASDFGAFFQTLLPSGVKLSDLKTDPPVAMPNTSPASHVWLINVKLTLTPTTDLLGLPPAADAQAVDTLVNELNGLVTWSNAYVHSPYARAYGEFEVKVPSTSVPQLLVVQQSKDRPMAPFYGKISAEWQVDHWNFVNVDLEPPETGKPRSSFTGNTMVQGSPEADAFFQGEREVIAKAKERKAAIETSYANDLLTATKPGTVYRGNIQHRRGTLPCEVQFLDRPGGDPKYAAFAVALTGEPGYQITYRAELATKMPVGSAGDDAGTGNLTAHWTKCEGKDHDGKTFPGLLVRGLEGAYTPRDLPFVVLNHRIEGLAAKNNGEFTLSAQASQ